MPIYWGSSYVHSNLHFSLLRAEGKWNLFVNNVLITWNNPVLTVNRQEKYCNSASFFFYLQFKSTTKHVWIYLHCFKEVAQTRETDKKEKIFSPCFVWCFFFLTFILSLNCADYLTVSSVAILNCTRQLCCFLFFCIMFFFFLPGLLYSV